MNELENIKNKEVIKYASEFDLIGHEPTIIITPEFKNIIDHLHLKIGNVEFSGQLFYHVQGNITNPSKMVITPIDFHLMDIGSSAHTSFDVDSSIIDVHDRNEKLLDNPASYRMGFLHSHHNMETFFSGEDLDELRLNTHKYPYYVSLIVNFNGKWDCRVCFESNAYFNIDYVDKHSNKTSKLKGKPAKSLVRLKCNIKSPVPNYLNERIEFIKKAKEDKKTMYSNSSMFESYWGQSYQSDNNYQKTIETKTTPNVFNKNNNHFSSFPSSSFSYSSLIAIIISKGLKSQLAPALHNFKKENISEALEYCLQSVSFGQKLITEFSYIKEISRFLDVDLRIELLNKITKQYETYYDNLLSMQGITQRNMGLLDEFMDELELQLEIYSAFDNQN